MPPEKFCGEHTSLVEKIGELRGDVKGLGRSVDTLRNQSADSFLQVERKASERHREIKLALNGTVKDLKFDDDEKTGEIQIVKQKVEKIDRWRTWLIGAGAVIFVLVAPLIGKLWDLIIKAFGG